MFIRTKVTANRVLLLVGQLWAVPLLILIRLVRPLVVIRIGVLFSEYFGHYSGNVELYLCERDSGINRLQEKHIDVWFNLTSVVSNRQLERMWGRQFKILPRFLLAPLYRLNQFIPGGQMHQIESTYHDRDVLNLLSTQLPHAVFTAEEEELGARLLAEMGIPEGAQFVCLNVRDGAFHSKLTFTNYRNADVSRYMLAAEELTKCGFFVIRMGKLVDQNFESSNPRILDYALSEFRSDFMDIYLGAKCFFAISTSSGWDNIPGVLFRRPVLYTNVVPISQVQSWNDNTLAIFKRHWFSEQGRFLTQSEIFHLIDKGFVSASPPFDELGVELVENTAEEIYDATMEMADMLQPEGLIYSDEEKQMQYAFWSFFKQNLQRNDLQYLHGDIRVRIGTKFLTVASEYTDPSIDPAIYNIRQ